MHAALSALIVHAQLPLITAYTEVSSEAIIKILNFGLSLHLPRTDAGFLERGFIYIKVWGFV